MTAARMQQRRDTAANWTTANPVLAAGEIGWESDTGRVKFGDGVTDWASLAAFTVAPPALVAYNADGAIAVTPHPAAFIKASAGAYTLAVPTAEQNGTAIPLLKVTNFDHTITVPAANSIIDSYSGNEGNRITLGSSNGHLTTLHAYGGKWYCNTAGGGSISDV